MGSLFLAFMAGFLLDFGWATYMRAVADGAAWRAAAVSTAIGGLSVVGVLSVVRDGWAIAPYLAGLFLGSLAAVKWGGANAQ